MSKNNTVFIGENRKFWDRNRRSGGYLLKKRSGQIALSIIRALLLFGLCFMIIQPLLTRFGIGLMEEKDLYDNTIILLPRHVTLDNYRIVAELTDLKKIGGEWTFRALGNTLWVSLLVSVCQIISCTLVAYGFARYEFKFKKFWFACVIALIIIPPQTIQSSLYTNFARFDLFRVFTLFGVNAEGKNFGERVMSIFDGTGTGIFSLFCASDKGLTLGDRINVMNLYKSGVIEDQLLAAMKNGSLTAAQIQQIINLSNAGLTTGQLQQLINTGINSNQLKDLLKLYNTGVTTDQLQILISQYLDGGKLDPQLWNMITSNQLSIQQLSDLYDLHQFGLTAEQITAFRDVFTSTLSKDQMDHLISLYQSGTLSAETIDLVLNNQLTLNNSAEYIGTILSQNQTAGLTMAQLQDLKALLGDKTSAKEIKPIAEQIKHLFELKQTGMSADQLQQLFGLLNAGRLKNDDLLALYSNGTIAAQVEMIQNSGFSGEQLRQFYSLCKTTITKEQMDQMIALYESGVMNQATADLLVSGDSTIIRQLMAMKDVHTSGSSIGNVLALMEANHVTPEQLKELQVLSGTGLTAAQMKQFFTAYEAGIRNGQLEEVRSLLTSGQLTQLVDVYKSNGNIDYPLSLMKLVDSGVVSGQLLESINSGKLQLNHLAALEGNVPGTDFLFSGVPMNLRSSIAAYVIMSLTCMGLKNGLYIYMMRQYFQGIPTSLEEAAYVDGCGTIHTFVKIMLPDALPTIASCFLFSFVWQWTDIFYTRLFLPSTTISMYSAQMSSMVSRMGRYFAADASKPVVVANGRQQQLISIAVLICAIPLVILYLFTQRTFVESLASSGSKE